MLIFAAVGLVTVMMVIKGHWVVYRNPTEHGVLWLIASLPLMLIWHDFYFYWTHRLMHAPVLFRHVHSVHHRSRQPSPFAAYAFHPLEAFVNSLMMPLALCAVPLPGVVLFIVGIHQIVRNAHGHLAVEIMPRGFARHWLGGRFTTTTHHHMHHETARGNYGLWFTWWDRIFGTEQADYLRRFDLVTQSRRSDAALSVAGRSTEQH
jgi:sterol desaturase/sphingolipid hydroxylase (fatty acid hydroxylase superfamily)